MRNKKISEPIPAEQMPGNKGGDYSNCKYFALGRPQHWQCLSQTDGRIVPRRSVM